MSEIETMANHQQHDLSSQLVREISLAAPAYNEAEGIGKVVMAWLEHLKSLEFLNEFEIIICNDGSSDRTGQILSDLSAAHSQIKVVHLPTNQGGAAAMNLAIKNTTCEWVLMIDSDGQYPIENLGRMVEVVTESEVKAVTAVRIKKEDSAFMIIGSKASGWLCNVFHHTQYKDFNCSLKLVRGDLLRALCLEARGLNYSTEVSSKLTEKGITMKEVRVEHLSRTSGRSKAQNLQSVWHRLLFVFYIGMRQLLIKQKVLQISPPEK